MQFNDKVVDVLSLGWHEETNKVYEDFVRSQSQTNTGIIWATNARNLAVLVFTATHTELKPAHQHNGALPQLHLWTRRRCCGDFVKNQGQCDSSWAILCMGELQFEACDLM